MRADENHAWPIGGLSEAFSGNRRFIRMLGCFYEESSCLTRWLPIAVTHQAKFTAYRLRKAKQAGFGPLGVTDDDLPVNETP